MRILLLGIGSASLLLLVGVWVVLFELVRQQGRILLRLDAAESGASASLAEPPSPRDALVPGTPCEPFRLLDQHGNATSLHDFRGRQLLLVHWDWACSFCRRIANDLDALRTQL